MGASSLHHQSRNRPPGTYEEGDVEEQGDDGDTQQCGGYEGEEYTAAPEQVYSGEQYYAAEQYSGYQQHGFEVPQQVCYAEQVEAEE